MAGAAEPKAAPVDAPNPLKTLPPAADEAEPDGHVDGHVDHIFHTVKPNHLKPKSHPHIPNPHTKTWAYVPDYAHLH